MRTNEFDKQDRKALRKLVNEISREIKKEKKTSSKKSFRNFFNSFEMNNNTIRFILFCFNWVGVFIVIILWRMPENYEKAIANWIQTDNSGTWTDLKFKLIEVVETKDITVADSAKIMETEFEKQKVARLSAYEKDIIKCETYLGFAKLSASPEEIQTIQNNLNTLKAQSDSIQTLTYYSVYADKKSTDILAKLKKCKYSIFSPELNTNQQKVETFLLTPDQDKCLGRMKKNI